MRKNLNFLVNVAIPYEYTRAVCSEQKSFQPPLFDNGHWHHYDEAKISLVCEGKVRNQNLFKSLITLKGIQTEKTFIFENTSLHIAANSQW